MRTFRELSYEEREWYIEWMEILIEDGRISEYISTGEFMDKLYRMLECDQNQSINPSAEFFKSDYIK